MKTAVILPAAGASRRFQQPGEGRQSKVELKLEGRPVFLRAVERFLDRADVGAVILAVPPDRLEAFELRWGDQLGFRGVKMIAGGLKERWETVKLALAAVPDDCTHVAVHDAARPLVTSVLIDRVFAAAAQFDAVIPAVSVSGTLKRATEPTIAETSGSDPLDAILGSAGKPQVITRQVIETVDRSNVVEVQTPQVFTIELMRKAYDNLSDGTGITDDAGLMEAMGQTVHIVEGEATNLKITRPADLALAHAIVAAQNRDTDALLERKRLFNDDDDQ